MANMSYCRFQNTESDLRDCVRALEDLEDDLGFDPDEAERLSEAEEAAAQRMERLCRQFLELRERVAQAEAEAARLERPQLPVLFMSGYTENAIQEGSQPDPRVPLLRKPFRQRELAETLRRVLDAASASGTWYVE